jgi:hypothetical protein
VLSDVDYFVWSDVDQFVWGDNGHFVWSDIDHFVWGDIDHFVWNDIDHFVWGDNGHFVWSDIGRSSLQSAFNLLTHAIFISFCRSKIFSIFHFQKNWFAVTMFQQCQPFS